MVLSMVVFVCVLPTFPGVFMFFSRSFSRFLGMELCQCFSWVLNGFLKDHPQVYRFFLGFDGLTVFFYSSKAFLELFVSIF